MANAIVRPGRRFGRLVAVALAQHHGRDNGGDRWTVRCDCGTVKDVWGSTLRQGRTHSCGCYFREVTARRSALGHAAGGKRTPTYGSWRAMRGRCSNPNNRAWPYYGGRGITVCDRWARFANFLADMGERPADMTLDRIDPDGNYEPGNCRWATPAEQTANRR